MGERPMNIYDKNRLEESPEIKPYFHDISPDIAAQAYHATSHFPERAGSLIRSDYAKMLLDDKKSVINSVNQAKLKGADIDSAYIIRIESWFIEHRKGLKAKFITYLHSHANVASSFICGPANFPVARNQKRSQWADNHYAAIGEFRKLSKKRILKQLLPFGDGSAIKTNDPKAVKKIDSKVEALEKQRDFMKLCNKTYRKFYKKGQKPEAGTDKYNDCVNALAEIGLKTDLTPDYMGESIPFRTWELSNLGANIRRLSKRANEVEQTQSTEINDTFPNGETAIISDDGKIVIEFGYKPDEDTRAVLKRHAFKWSRVRVAWVRKVTANALADYSRSIKPMLMDS